jgi:predicted dehydrogenase
MLRLAVVGAGHLGRIHAKLARELEEVELVGVVDQSEEAALRLASECGVSSFTNLAEIAGQVDAAIVATTTTTHHAVGCQLLRHGIHVLIEKPLASNLAECDELVRLAEQNGLVLQVGHIERFNPALDQALPHLRGPRYIDAVRYSGYTFRSTDIGVVLDLMIHDLDLAMTLAGAPVADVSAFGLTVLGRHEDVARARLHFANGVIADLSASRVSYQAMRKMQVWISRAHVNLDFATRTAVIAQPAAIVRQGRFDPDQLSLAEKSRLKDRVFEELIPLRRLEAGAVNALVEEQRDFVAAIRTRREPRVTGRQAREVIAVAERILASLAVARWQSDSADSGAVPRLPEEFPAKTPQHAADSPDILRGPHWRRAPAASSQGMKRPA